MKPSTVCSDFQFALQVYRLENSFVTEHNPTPQRGGESIRGEMGIRFVRVIAAAALAATMGYGQGAISTVAGTANCCVTTSGGAATSTWLPSLGQMAIDKQGSLYFWDGPQIRKVSGGIISTVAGNGQSGYNGDGGPATSATLFPHLPDAGLAIDSAGNLYLSDAYNQVIREVNAATGIITTIAGNGKSGFVGDGGPATQASLFFPSGLALDSAGNLYISDQDNYRVRKVTASTGVISTFAGNGNAGQSVTDGVAATASVIEQPSELAFDSAGNLYIAEDDRIRKVDSGGIIHTIAGVANATTPGFTGDGGPAISAEIFGPLGMVFDSAGNLYFADNQNQRIRKINTAGTISTFAGINGNASSPLGDGGLATAAYIGNPLSLVMDAAGDLIFTASPASFYDIRKIAPSLGLSASPGSVPFSFAIGGTVPGSQSVNVTSTGTAIGFTAAASTTSGNWLSITPASGTTPATLTISVNPAGLASSSTPYQGTITLTPTGSGGSPFALSVTLTVTGAGSPVITSGGIVNALGYQTTLAPDTVFVIFGSAMGPAALQSATAPNYPPSLGGTSISFTPTSGGAAISAKMIYTSAGQIAGLLPSSIAAGTYNVQVTYNNLTGASQTVTVAARSFGIATSNSAGTGAAQATIGNVNGGLSLVRLTTGSLAYEGYNWTLTPSHPSDTLVLWGTGGGADALNDTGGSSGDQTAAGNFSVSVDGISITPLYAGASSGYPGLWQINFTLPANIAPDCFATLQVSAGGNLSNQVTISIAAAGQSSCSSTISAATLSALDSGGTIVMAGLVIGESTYTSGSTTIVSESVGGVFNKYTAAEFLLPYSGPKVGACTILRETYPANGKEPSAPDSQLDAGTLTISGPGISLRNVGATAGATGPDYYSALTAGTLQGGAYTLTGPGGAQVGPFSATATFPSNFAVTNLSSLATINRAQPLTVNWTGTGFDQVSILIQGDILTTTTTQAVSVSCVVPAAPGTYAVPAAALAYLPAVAAGSQNVGQVSITASPSAGGTSSAESATSTSLTPSLVSGGQVNFGAFTPYISFSLSAAIQ